jgi:nucleoid-associated protein YgaU
LGIGVEESSEELVIEEKRVGDDIDLEEADGSMNDASAALSDTSPGEDISLEDGSSAEAVSSITNTSVEATSGQEAAAATSSGGEQTNGQEDGTQKAAEETEEYIVKEGDTLAAICKYKYGSLTRLKDICSLNHIKDADYIAPGQKLYLPE